MMREPAGLSVVAAGWLATINFTGYLAGALAASKIRTLAQKFVLYRVGLILAVCSTMSLTSTFSCGWRLGS
jgi:Uncharacterised MFS-type transporter YbfB